MRAAAIEAVERYGTGVTGSRLLNGTLPSTASSRSCWPTGSGMEAALVFTTGYAANLGLLGALVGPDDAAVVDSAAHASLVDGARFSRGHAAGLPPQPAQQPAAHPAVVAGAARRRRGAGRRGRHLLHGGRLGAAGRDRRGLRGRSGPACSSTRPTPSAWSARAAPAPPRPRGVQPDLVMGTFSKSLASCGGFIAGARSVIDYLKVTCRPLMFTASGVPAALAAALEAARIAQAEDWRREAVVARAEQLRAGLAAARLPGRRAEAESAIVAVHVGDNWEAGSLWKALLDHGVYTNCAIPPAVPRALLRTSVMATHTEADIDRALEGFRPGSGLTGLRRVSPAGSLVEAPHLRPVGPHGLELVVDAVVGGQRPRRLRGADVGIGRQPVDDLPVQQRTRGQVLVVGADAEGPDPGVAQLLAPGQQRVPAEREQPARAHPPHELVDVGEGQAYRHRWPSRVSSPNAQLGLMICFSCLARCRTSASGIGAKPQLSLHAALYTSKKRPDLGVEVVHSGCRGRRPRPAAGCGRGSRAGVRTARWSRLVEMPGPQVHGRLPAVIDPQRLVVRRVLQGQQGRGARRSRRPAAPARRWW